MFLASATCELVGTALVCEPSNGLFDAPLVTLGRCHLRELVGPLGIGHELIDQFLCWTLPCHRRWPSWRLRKELSVTHGVPIREVVVVHAWCSGTVHDDRTCFGEFFNAADDSGPVHSQL